MFKKIKFEIQNICPTDIKSASNAEGKSSPFCNDIYKSLKELVESINKEFLPQIEKYQKLHVGPPGPNTDYNQKRLLALSGIMIGELTKRMEFEKIVGKRQVYDYGVQWGILVKPGPQEVNMNNDFNQLEKAIKDKFDEIDHFFDTESDRLGFTDAITMS